MVSQKRYFYLSFPLLVVLTVFSGCMTPVTKNDFNALASNPPINKSGEREEPKKPEDLQYYSSKKITLILISEPLEFTVDGGILKERNQKIRKRITIPKNLPGKLLSTDVNGNLEVGFEKGYPDCRIWFKKPAENDEKYNLIYDTVHSSITYGSGVYTVKFSGNELPFLKIKRQQELLHGKETRRASGWKVGE